MNSSDEGQVGATAGVLASGYGAVSLTTANGCPGEAGLLSEEVRASWGNGREEARMLLEFITLTRQGESAAGEPEAQAPMCFLLQGLSDLWLCHG